MIKKPKGTLDILPKETVLWHYVEGIIRESTKNAGFKEIRVPTFEKESVYRRGVGNTTDIVQKEMFTLESRNDEEERFCLRPEGTAGVVRSMVENGLYNDAMPLKLYYVGPFFRYEKPQAGRSREFYQFGVELFGADSAYADASVIALADDVLKKTGIHASLHINSIGCPECRKHYREALVNYFENKKEQLCDTCKERLKTNPLRLLDCKSPICHGIASDAPKTVDYLCEGCRDHFETLKKALNTLHMDYEVDPMIVRGLDYYVRTVFEFISDDIGAQSTVCGGGRYDGLVEQLEGPKLSGIGFGMGLTRLILALNTLAEQGKITLPTDEAPALYVAPLGESAMQYALGLTEELRQKHIYAECDIVSRSLKAQMKYADKIGAKYVLVVGDNEIAEGKAELKNMRDKDDRQTVSLADVASYIQ